MNFFKKTMWELSGHSREEWTLNLWDGSYFRNMITVYGSPKIFDQMAEGMLQWADKFYKRKAIFANKRGSKMLYLIWLDGEFIHPAVGMEHDAFNMNPGNDKEFCRELPVRLEDVKKQRGRLTTHA